MKIEVNNPGKHGRDTTLKLDGEDISSFAYDIKMHFAIDDAVRAEIGIIPQSTFIETDAEIYFIHKDKKYKLLKIYD